MDFVEFYETWYAQLHHLSHKLSRSPHPPTTVDDRQLVDEVMSHYADYNRVNSLAANQDVLYLFSAPWSTTLERSLHWISGWRPTTAFHLVYTESSILIMGTLDVLRTGALGDLSPAQFSRVSELQCETVQEENDISDQLSEWQEGAAELLGTCVDLQKKMEGLVKIVEKADELRLQTLKKVVELLTARQAVEFLIGASQLQSGIRRCSLNHEGGRRDANINHED